MTDYTVLDRDNTIINTYAAGSGNIYSFTIPSGNVSLSPPKKLSLELLGLLHNSMGAIKTPTMQVWFGNHITPFVWFESTVCSLSSTGNDHLTKYVIEIWPDGSGNSSNAGFAMRVMQMVSSSQPPTTGKGKLSDVAGNFTSIGGNDAITGINTTGDLDLQVWFNMPNNDSRLYYEQHYAELTLE